MKTPIQFPEFTPEASSRWYEIPPPQRERILDAVCCSKCHSVRGVRMKLETGFMSGDNLILNGTCTVCGEGVTRLVEPEGG